MLELSTGRPREAAQAFRRAVEAEPSRGDAWQGLGAALIEHDRPAAIDAWRRAERLLPNDFDLLFNLGMVLADGPSPREALPYLERFAREAPRDRYRADLARVEAVTRTGAAVSLARAWARLSVALAVLAISCNTPAPPPPAPAAAALPRANVLLVTIDTLRADRVGAYGGPAGLTPTLDRLAAEGLRGDTVYAHVPLTLPSHTAIMTGAYPHLNGVRDNGSFRFDGKLPTLASTLKSAGYRTGAFVASFVLDARFGLNVGFDVYDDRYGARPAGGDLSQVERPAGAVLDSAVEWIVGAEQPWFAWAHLYDPHDPYDPPEPFRSRFATDPYAGEIAFADERLGVALAELSRRGRLTNTLVIVAADHGESLGEHQERTHGLFAYDATLRVPLVIWAPPAIPPGVLRGPGQLVDVMPTVLDLVGVPAEVPNGRSLWSFANSGTPGLGCRRLLRGAQCEPHKTLGAAHRCGLRWAQVHRPADSRVVRPRRGSGRASQRVCRASERRGVTGPAAGRPSCRGRAASTQGRRPRHRAAAPLARIPVVPSNPVVGSRH